MRVDSSVEPTRSQNRTVSWRSSPSESPSKGSRAACVSSAAPHSEQNLASGVTTEPQAGHPPIWALIPAHRDRVHTCAGGIPVLPEGPGGGSVPIVLQIAARSVLRQVQAGHIEIIDGPRRHSFGPTGADLQIEVRVNSPRFWRDLLRGSAALGEAYGDGVWDCDDLVALVRIGAREMPRIDRLRRPLVPL